MIPDVVIVVPEEGLEPSQPGGPRDFESFLERDEKYPLSIWRAVVAYKREYKLKLGFRNWFPRGTGFLGHAADDSAFHGEEGISSCTSLSRGGVTSASPAPFTSPHAVVSEFASGVPHRNAFVLGDSV